MEKIEVEMFDGQPAYLDPMRTHWSYPECQHFLHRKTGQSLTDKTLYQYAFLGCYNKMPKRPFIERVSFMQWISSGCPVRNAQKIIRRQAG